MVQVASQEVCQILGSQILIELKWPSSSDRLQRPSSSMPRPKLEFCIHKVLENQAQYRGNLLDCCTYTYIHTVVEVTCKTKKAIQKRHLSFQGLKRFPELTMFWTNMGSLSLLPPSPAESDATPFLTCA